MKAVILAGGLGTRLKPFTEVIPKPLLPLGESSVLEIQVRALKRAEFDEVFIATNYMADYVEAFLGDGSKSRHPYHFQSRNHAPRHLRAAAAAAGPPLRAVPADEWRHPDDHGPSRRLGVRGAVGREPDRLHQGDQGSLQLRQGRLGGRLHRRCHREARPQVRDSRRDLRSQAAGGRPDSARCVPTGSTR